MLDYIPQKIQTAHCHQPDVARLPDWGQSEAKPPADVEIGTSLGWYSDFPPTPEPFLSCSPYSEFPIICYRYWTTLAYFGLYRSRPVITLPV